VANAGGKIAHAFKPGGIATAESADPDFAKRLASTAGITAVAEDTVIQWVGNERTVEGNAVGDTERWFPIQWNLTAIKAQEAWNIEKGRGARVAILDGGIWNQHVDLAPNLDVRASRSFVTGITDPFTDVGTFWHGTHVAGIVAAADNADNLGTIGIAPEATLIGAKVLHNGTGAFGGVIMAIRYAATPKKAGGAGADIINMSLGAQLPSAMDSKVRALKALLDDATTFAHQQGVLVIASTGNGDKQGRGIDHDLGQWFSLPAQAEHVTAVSALGPVGFARGATNFDRLASYSNFGLRIVDLSGPGGDSVFPGDELCTMAINPGPAPTTTEVTRACWIFDMVVSSCRGDGTANVCWASGTSMSTPAVSAVAALIVGQKGRRTADALLADLVSSSDDLGAPGTDPIYGKGRVNALNAVRGR
jgi:subtilisin family serine protease